MPVSRHLEGLPFPIQSFNILFRQLITDLHFNDMQFGNGLDGVLHPGRDQA